MSLTLYRKYRPKTFAELTGQNHIKLTLQHQLESGNVAHAYLFTGPRGVGKTTTARLLAAAVNKARGSDAEQIWEGRDLDIIEIDAASNTGVDHVREVIIENARFTPVRHAFKVFIIDEVHMLSTAAFNALLKILEEPPAHAIFILATTELQKVPATIISRCQRFDFKKIPSHDMLERLNQLAASEGVQVDREVLLDISRRSEGCLRDAESLLGQVLSLQQKTITAADASLVLPVSQFSQVFALLDQLSRRDSENALATISQAIEEGTDTGRMCGDILETLRLLMVIKSSPRLSPGSIDVPAGYEMKIIEVSKQFSLADIVRLIDIFSKKRLEIKTAIMPQLPLEVGIVEFCMIGAPAQVQAAVRTAPVAQPAQPLQKKETPVQSLSKKILAAITPEEDAPAETLNGISMIPLEEVKQKWGTFLGRLQQLNPSLVLILKTAEPMNCGSGKLTIGYKYPFHKQRMDQPANRDIVERIFGEVFNGKVTLENTALASDYVSDFIASATSHDEVELLADAFVAENSTSLANQGNQKKQDDAPKNQEDIIRNLVSVFGGRVVE